MWQQEQQQGVQEASGGGELVQLKAKHALVGAGARVLFYPTLLYNVLRNRFEADFRWWDRVDQVLTLPSFCSAWIMWLVACSSVDCNRSLSSLFSVVKPVVSLWV